MTTSDTTAGQGPQCEQHGPMAERASLTPEQAWCGVWFDCPAPHCRTSALRPSAALHDQYANAGQAQA